MTKEEVDAALLIVEKSISGMEWWVIPFAWLVAIGVAGEAFIGVKQLFNNRELHRLRVIQTELIDKDRAKLQIDVADAKDRAAKSELALEKLKNNRVVSSKLDVAKKINAFRGTEWDLSVATNNLEADGLAASIAVTLRIAGWVQVAWNGPVPSRRIAGPSLPVGPLPSSFGGIFTRGTLVTVDPEVGKNPDSPQVKAAKALCAALDGAGLECDGIINMKLSANTNAVHVVVGPK